MMGIAHYILRSRRGEWLWYKELSRGLKHPMSHRCMRRNINRPRREKFETHKTLEIVAKRMQAIENFQVEDN